MKKILLSVTLLSALFSTNYTALAQETTTVAETQATTTTDWAAYETDFTFFGRNKPIEQVFFNDTPIKEDTDQATYTIERYAYYKLKDDPNNSNILMIELSIKNKTDQPLYTAQILSGTISGVGRIISSSYLTFLDEKLDLHKKLEAIDYTIAPQSEVKGAIILDVKPDEAPLLEKAGFFQLETLGLYPQKETYDNSIFGYENSTPLPLTAEGLAKLNEQDSFYADMATTERWGIKTMIEAKELGETKSDNDIDVTVNGVEIVNFKLDEEMKYNSFLTRYGDELVLITIDTTIKNNGSHSINLDGVSTYLTGINNVIVKNDRAYEQAISTDSIATGSEAQRYFVYPLTIEEYEKFSTDKIEVSFEIMNTNLERLTNPNLLKFQIK